MHPPIVQIAIGLTVFITLAGIGLMLGTTQRLEHTGGVARNLTLCKRLRWIGFTASVLGALALSFLARM